MQSGGVCTTDIIDRTFWVIVSSTFHACVQFGAKNPEIPALFLYVRSKFCAAQT